MKLQECLDKYYTKELLNIKEFYCRNENITSLEGIEQLVIFSFLQ